MNVLQKILHKKPMTRTVTLSAIIAALYAATTVLLAPISYGPMQVRIAEALTVLPYLYPEAIPGLYFGCMAANIWGGYGPIDIFGGSAVTLMAALLTFYLRRFGKPWLAPLPPVVLNALAVGYYLHLLTETPLGLSIGMVGAGQLVACFGLGLPLLYALSRRNLF
ncbi:MAG: QueT transporter family protein [candidate division KSB1 bacterium]|nr:QueT transporter family protein [candidate division KSB1 bacterium]